MKNNETFSTGYPRVYSKSKENCFRRMNRTIFAPGRLFRHDNLGNIHMAHVL